MAGVGRDGVDDELFDFIEKQIDKIEYGDDYACIDPDDVKKRTSRELAEQRKRERKNAQFLARMTPEERAEFDAKVKDMSNAYHYWTRERFSTNSQYKVDFSMEAFHEFLRNEWQQLKVSNKHTKWDFKSRR
jgi:hypothetical protein